MLKKSLKRSKSWTRGDTTQQYSKTEKPKKIQQILGDKSSKDEDEQVLERVVLGGEDDILENLEKGTNKAKRKKNSYTVEAPPAWEDEDDDINVKISRKDFRHKYFKHKDQAEVSGSAYTQTLKTQFEKVTGQPSWAKLEWQKSDNDEESSDEDAEAQNLLQVTGNYLSKTDALPRDILQIKPCTDANAEQPSRSVIKALEFHPTAQVILTGGPTQTLSLFQVDGKSNPKIQSVFLDKFPILSGHFTRDGSQVVLASKHQGFKYYDMLGGQVVNVPKIKGLEETKMNHFEMSPDGKYIVFCGSYGRMHLLSVASKEWIATLKMNGELNAVAFAPDGSKMFSHGDDGEVYVWDMRTRDCIHRFVDDGCIKGTSLAVSNNGQYIAAGSYSGVVNIYDESCLTESRPTPLKAVMNLTTPCTNMAFNSTSEILCIASNCAERAVKMVHTSSMTVFSNYPGGKNRLLMPYVIDFSLNSGYFSIGNNKGHALLYRLKHYGNY